jgi:NAD(P)H dehydrogenase (quinone)
MKFAIAGVTGHTGRVAADLLLAQGHTVRVLVRDAAKGAAWAAKGAEVAIADVSDGPSLTAALTGVDAAWILLPPNLGTGDFRAWQFATGRIVVDAIGAAKVPHVVLLSSVGAQHAAGTGPIAGIHPVEKGLAALPATGASFVRAAYFMENLLGNLGMLDQGLYPSFSPADAKMPMIATVDIGALAAKLLAGPAPKPGAPAIYELGGGPYSASDVAGVLSAIKGQPIKVVEAPVSAMAQTLQGFGFPPDIAALYQEMTEGAAAGLVAYDGTGHPVAGTTSLETFLRGALGA